jgi:hypothetical protein
MEVTGQLHAPTALLPAKEPPVSTAEKGWVVPQPVWMRWRRGKNPRPYREQNPCRKSHGLVTIPTEEFILRSSQKGWTLTTNTQEGLIVFICSSTTQTQTAQDVQPIATMCMVHLSSNGMRNVSKTQANVFQYPDKDFPKSPRERTRVSMKVR